MKTPEENKIMKSSKDFMMEKYKTLMANYLKQPSLYVVYIVKNALSWPGLKYRTFGHERHDQTINMIIKVCSGQRFNVESVPLAFL